jgi:GH15 family glucan-1,4-alpha-glucosidase
VAALTMSLPERLGGDRNWDYRYAWPRDAGIGSGAFMASGRTDEARAFLRWLDVASRLTLPQMSVLYTLDGTSGHGEREIKGVSGYRNSLPVRAANAAAKQHQLDVYGWVIDTAWHLVSRGEKLEAPKWRMLRSLADFVADHWRNPDAGLWEERGDPRHHVSSKLMAYVALDRAVRIAQTRRDDHAEVERWVSESQALRSQVRRHGWSDELQTYTAAYGSTDLDASVLLVAMSELENDAPERISSTVDAVRRRLGAGGVLIYRTLESTSPDDAGEGAFIACSFWLIDALARCGRIDEAEKLMSQAVTLGGGLGLLAEECDPASGQMLGNYPQALSHSTLVSAALSIEAAKASKTHRAARRTPRERQA